MAFIWPVMKNDYDLYKSNRNRSSSDSTSGASSRAFVTKPLFIRGTKSDGTMYKQEPGKGYQVRSQRAINAGGSKPITFRPSSQQPHYRVASRSSSINSRSSVQSTKSATSRSSSSSSSSGTPKVPSTSSPSFTSSLFGKFLPFYKSKDSSSSKSSSKGKAKK